MSNEYINGAFVSPQRVTRMLRMFSRDGECERGIRRRRKLYLEVLACPTNAQRLVAVDDTHTTSDIAIVKYGCVGWTSTVSVPQVTSGFHLSSLMRLLT